MRNLFVVAVVSVVGLALIISQLFREDPTQSFSSATNELALIGITDYKIEFRDKIIILNIITNKVLTCKQIVDALGVENFMIKDHTYSPKCKIVSPTLATVIYKETVSI